MMLEPADKPGFVVDSHSSSIYVTIDLKQPTRTQCGSHRWVPIWSCSEWGLPCHKLLPVARCALTAPFHPYLILLLLKGHRRSTLCCTFRRLTPPRHYLALYPAEPGLSSPLNGKPYQAATVWPTPSEQGYKEAPHQTTSFFNCRFVMPRPADKVHFSFDL